MLRMMKMTPLWMLVDFPSAFILASFPLGFGPQERGARRK